MSTPVAEIVDRLVRPAGREDRLTHLEVLSPYGPPYAVLEWVDPALVEAWRARGVESPWTHQAEAAQAAYDGRHVVVSTGTASGKSLAYLMPHSPRW